MSIFRKLFGGKKHPASASDPLVAEEIATLAGCDWERVNPTLNAVQVTALYRDALCEGELVGFHPLLVVTSRALLDTLQANFKHNAGVEAYRERLLMEECADGEEFLRKRMKQVMPEDAELADELTGSFDEIAAPQMQLAAVGAKERRPDEELILLKLPLTRPWRCFAYLPAGNRHACPNAVGLMSVCRLWYEQYGAVPAMLSKNELQLYVAKPLTRRTQAMELAAAQYAFCSDIVDRCTETLGALAGMLTDAAYWYFWWE